MGFFTNVDFGEEEFAAGFLPKEGEKLLACGEGSNSVEETEELGEMEVGVDR